MEKKLVASEKAVPLPPVICDMSSRLTRHLVTWGVAVLRSNGPHHLIGFYCKGV